MAKKANTDRLALYVIEDTSYQSYRIRAHVVTLGPTKNDPGLASDVIQGPGDQMRGGLFFQDLQARSYGYEPSNPDQLRSVSFYDPLGYQDVFNVNLRTAKKMAATLATIERRLERIRQRSGHAVSFGAYLAQVGEAIGATAMVFVRERHGSSYNDNTHRVTSLGEGVAQVDYYARHWIEKGVAAKDAARVA